MVYNTLDDKFKLDILVAKLLALKLPDERDRIIATKWIKKFLLSTNEEDTNRRDHYLKLLLLSLQRKHLVGPFKTVPTKSDRLEQFEEDYQLVDIGKLILEEEFKKYGSPPYTVEVSGDLHEYSVYQEIPEFGAHFYYAYSPEPIGKWMNLNKAILPRGCFTVKAISLPDTSILLRSQDESTDSQDKTKDRKGLTKRKKTDKLLDSEDKTILTKTGALRQEFLNAAGKESEDAAIGIQLLQESIKAGIVHPDELKGSFELGFKDGNVRFPPLESVVVAPQEGDEKVAEELTAEQLKEERLKKMPKRLRERLEKKFVPEIQKKYPGRDKFNRTPPIFSDSAVGPYRKYKPGEFGEGKHEKFTAGPKFFQNMEYSPTEREGRKQMIDVVKEPREYVRRPKKKKKGQENKEDTVISSDKDSIERSFEKSLERRKILATQQKQMSPRSKRLQDRLNELRQTEACKDLDFDDIEVDVTPEIREFTPLVYTEMPDEDEPVSILEDDEMETSDIFGEDQICEPERPPEESLDCGLLDEDMETSDIFGSDAVADPDMQVFRDIQVEASLQQYQPCEAPINDFFRYRRQQQLVPGQPPIDIVTVDHPSLGFDSTLLDDDETPPMSKTVFDKYLEKKMKKLKEKTGYDIMPSEESDVCEEICPSDTSISPECEIDYDDVFGEDQIIAPQDLVPLSPGTIQTRKIDDIRERYRKMKGEPLIGPPVKFVPTVYEPDLMDPTDFEDFECPVGILDDSIPAEEDLQEPLIRRPRKVSPLEEFERLLDKEFNINANQSQRAAGSLITQNDLDFLNDNILEDDEMFFEDIFGASQVASPLPMRDIPPPPPRPVVQLSKGHYAHLLPSPVRPGRDVRFDNLAEGLRDGGLDSESMPDIDVSQGSENESQPVCEDDILDQSDIPPRDSSYAGPITDEIVDDEDIECREPEEQAIPAEQVQAELVQAEPVQEEPACPLSPTKQSIAESVAQSKRVRELQEKYRRLKGLPTIQQEPIPDAVVALQDQEADLMYPVEFKSFQDNSQIMDRSITQGDLQRPLLSPPYSASDALERKIDRLMWEYSGMSNASEGILCEDDMDTEDMFGTSQIASPLPIREMPSPVARVRVDVPNLMYSPPQFPKQHARFLDMAQEPEGDRLEDISMPEEDEFQREINVRPRPLPNISCEENLEDEVQPDLEESIDRSILMDQEAVIEDMFSESRMAAPEEPQSPVSQAISQSRAVSQKAIDLKAKYRQLRGLPPVEEQLAPDYLQEMREGICPRTVTYALDEPVDAVCLPAPLIEAPASPPPPPRVCAIAAFEAEMDQIYGPHSRDDSLGRSYLSGSDMNIDDVFGDSQIASPLPMRDIPPPPPPRSPPKVHIPLIHHLEPEPFPEKNWRFQDIAQASPECRLEDQSMMYEDYSQSIDDEKSIPLQHRSLPAHLLRSMQEQQRSNQDHHRSMPEYLLRSMQNQSMQSQNRSMQEQQRSMQEQQRSMQEQQRSMQQQNRSMQQQQRSMQEQQRSMQERSLQEQQRSMQEQHRSLQERSLPTNDGSILQEGEMICDNMQQALPLPLLSPTKQAIAESVECTRKTRDLQTRLRQLQGLEPIQYEPMPDPMARLNRVYAPEHFIDVMNLSIPKEGLDKPLIAPPPCPIEAYHQQLMNEDYIYGEPNEDDLLSSREMEISDMFGEDQIASPVPLRDLPSPPPRQPQTPIQGQRYINYFDASFPDRHLRFENIAQQQRDNRLENESILEFEDTPRSFKDLSLPNISNEENLEDQEEPAMDEDIERSMLDQDMVCDEQINMPSPTSALVAQSRAASQNAIDLKAKYRELKGLPPVHEEPLADPYESYRQEICPRMFTDVLDESVPSGLQQPLIEAPPTPAPQTPICPIEQYDRQLEEFYRTDQGPLAQGVRYGPREQSFLEDYEMETDDLFAEDQIAAPIPINELPPLPPRTVRVDVDPRLLKQYVPYKRDIFSENAYGEKLDDQSFISYNEALDRTPDLSSSCPQPIRTSTSPQPRVSTTPQPCLPTSPPRPISTTPQPSPPKSPQPRLSLTQQPYSPRTPKSRTPRSAKRITPRQLSFDQPNLSATQQPCDLEYEDNAPYPFDLLSPIEFRNFREEPQILDQSICSEDPRTPLIKSPGPRDYLQFDDSIGSVKYPSPERPPPPISKERFQDIKRQILAGRFGQQRNQENLNRDIMDVTPPEMPFSPNASFSYGSPQVNPLYFPPSYGSPSTQDGKASQRSPNRSIPCPTTPRGTAQAIRDSPNVYYPQDTAEESASYLPQERASPRSPRALQQPCPVDPLYSTIANRQHPTLQNAPPPELLEDQQIEFPEDLSFLTPEEFYATQPEWGNLAYALYISSDDDDDDSCERRPQSGGLTPPYISPRPFLPDGSPIGRTDILPHERNFAWLDNFVPFSSYGLDAKPKTQGRGRGRGSTSCAPKASQKKVDAASRGRTRGAPQTRGNRTMGARTQASAARGRSTTGRGNAKCPVRPAPGPSRGRK